jgi:alanyl-tRNA synthetase
MGAAFPELRRHPDAVSHAIREEEELFGKTLDRGIALFAEAAESGGAAISGRDAFELYATYGFPLDLTQLMARERGMTVDEAGFAAELERHREISRAGGGAVDLRQALLDALANDSLPPTEFLGYTSLVAEAVPVQRLLRQREDGRFEPASVLGDGARGAVVVERTPFYAEAGGQVGDAGFIRSKRGDVFAVEQTIKLGETHFHLGRVEQGKLAADRAVSLAVDEPRRKKTMAHHTATHVMNWALRAVLGDHVQQKGSLVDDEKTRFDFSHNKPVTAEQTAAIESHVADVIRKDLAVYANVAPQQDALKIHGLRAVFGEKYPPMVRVVSIGAPVEQLLADPAKADWYDYSIEFCGGTHVERTGRIGAFTIVSEEAVAKGVRRVTAVAGGAAAQAAADGAALWEQVERLKTRPPQDLEKSIAAVIESLGAVTAPVAVKAQVRAALAELQLSLKEQQKQRAKSATDEIVVVARRIADENAGPVIVAMLEDADNQGLRTAMDVVRQRRPDGALLLGSAKDGKVSFVAAVPPALIAKGLNAGEWVRTAATEAGGSGGGRPEMAQAGAKEPARLPAALEAARKFANAKLNP